MIQITTPTQGAVLNHNHGIETEKSLKIKVAGISQAGTPVMVNGVFAKMDGLNFSAEVELTQRVNKITATAYTVNGLYTQEVTVLWDKKSFKRFGFYIDDHSFLFTDLAKERPAKAFDHFYLAALKRIHEKYGAKFTLNSFFHNDHHEFTLDQMPDIWKSEFIDNSDWLKFSFHAKSEFPDRPYAEASAEEFAADWDQVQREVERFAGKESFILPVVIHWANINMPVMRECIRRGMKCYSNTCRLHIMGGPSLAERQSGGAFKDKKFANEGENILAKIDDAKGDQFDIDMGIKLHYGFTHEESRYDNHGNYYDPLVDMIFFRSHLCSNLVPLDEISGKLGKVLSAGLANGNEAFCVGGHEQYSFPYYVNYLPDHIERIDLLCKIFAEAGCKGVHFAEGDLGNEAWK